MECIYGVNLSPEFGSCRTWAIVCLTVAFVWQLYTLRLLVNLHEPVAGGTRYSRYMHLATTVFGNVPIPIHPSSVPGPRASFTRQRHVANDVSFALFHAHHACLALYL